MPGCPNCGRETLRTEDWVCQWCGYPLLSRAYKSIGKTYKQLQEERRQSLGLSEPEPEPEPVPEPEPEVEPEPRDEVGLKRKPGPKRKAKARPEPEPEVEPELETEPEPEPELELEPEPEPEVEPEPEPEPEPQLEPKTKQTLKANLVETSDGILISVDELNTIFQADKVAAHAGLTEKALKITGLVDKVFVRDHIDIRYIILTGTKKGVWSVRCTFGKESLSQLNRLNNGQTVTVHGKYDGYGKNILVKDCVLTG